MRKLSFVFALGLFLVLSGVSYAQGPTGTPTPTSSPNPSVTPTPGGVALPSLPNPLEEAEKLLRGFEESWLPMKDAMFLGGHIIGLLGPGLECLKVFAYLFYVPYLFALLRWFVRKEPWTEIFAGRSGFWLFMMIIAGAPAVYLTTLHNIAYTAFLADNGTVREALGWTLTGFSPDVNLDTLKNVLVFIPVLTAWHISYEALLFVTFPFFIIWSGLSRNSKPLQAWGVAYVSFAAFGVLWFICLKAIEWYHGGPEMGLTQSNFFRSTITVVNYVFIGVSFVLAAMLTLIPLIHMFRVSFGGRSHGGVDWGSALNELLQWLVVLGMTNKQPVGAGAWNMPPPAHPGLDRGQILLPPPPVDGGNGTRGGGGGNGGGGTQKDPDVILGESRVVDDGDGTTPVGKVDVDNWQKPRSGDTASSSVPRVILEHGLGVAAVVVGRSHPIAGLVIEGVQQVVRVYKEEQSSRNDQHQIPPLPATADAATAVTVAGVPSVMQVPAVDLAQANQTDGTTLVGTDHAADSQADGRVETAADERVVATTREVPSVDMVAPQADETVVANEATATQTVLTVDGDGAVAPAASTTVAVPVAAKSTAPFVTRKTYRMGTMKRDYTAGDIALSESEPVIITEIREHTVLTSDGHELPKEIVDFNEEA